MHATCVSRCVTLTRKRVATYTPPIPVHQHSSSFGPVLVSVGDDLGAGLPLHGRTMSPPASAILKGKVALVTGSTQGIGLAIIRALASAGADVAMHGLPTAPELTAQRRELISSEFGVGTMYSDADLRDPAAIRAMVKRVQDEFGR